VPLDFKGYEKLLKNLSEEEKAAAIFAVGMRRCLEMDRSNSNTWWSNQMCNINNALAHRDSTGREILEQMEGEINGWVASIGTGGTLLGVSDALRKEHPSIKVIGVEPTDAPITEWVRSGMMNRFIEALRVPKRKLLIEDMFEKDLPDEIMTVTHKDARGMAYRLCMEEGLFCGISSGANVHAAIQLSKSLGRGSKVVTVLVDRRDRYYSEHPNEHYVI
jgi:cysteine synthase A